MVPTVLTIAGSDSSGGAGIQADLKTISACGGYGASVITAITAQNTHGVQAATDLGRMIIVSQLDAVFDDLDVAAVKTGMLSSAEIVETVADDLAHRRPRNLVCDPVMLSKTGFPLLDDDAVDAVITRLIPLATIVTPNVHEAERLAGLPVRDERSARAAGRKIRDLGAAAVLVKGGHLEAAQATDVLVTDTGTMTFPGERIETDHTHGTGCMLSAAIATHLAHGLDLEEAVRASKVFLTNAIRAGFAVGGGVSPPDPFFAWRGTERPSEHECP